MERGQATAKDAAVNLDLRKIYNTNLRMLSVKLRLNTLFTEAWHSLSKKEYTSRESWM